MVLSFRPTILPSHLWKLIRSVKYSNRKRKRKNKNSPYAYLESFENRRIWKYPKTVDLICKFSTFFFTHLRNQTDKKGKIIEERPIYQEATKSSLDPDSSPFLSYSPEILRMSTNHCGHCSCKSISHWRIRPFRSCSVVSFETFPWGPQIPWRTPP